MRDLDVLSAPGPVAVFADDVDGQALRFSQPSTVLRAETPARFFEALQQAEAARRAGGWLAGYISYEAGYLLEPKLASYLPRARRGPLLHIGVFDTPERLPLALPADFDEGLCHGTGLRDARALWSGQAYRRRFERLHDHLRRGDCYQANLTFPIEARWHGRPAALFSRLRARQPVRYGALVDFGWPVIVSRSPELFFSIDGEGWIEARPMKGTMRRASATEDDETLKAGLRNDPKNQAENRMIVDLLRNDLSRLCEPGSLSVPRLFDIETYPTVHQMVSHVRARLSGSPTLREIFSALFPCGSITGAPKIRAMEILRVLEDGPRDAYCGAIGWCAPEGPMRFSVAIRTLSLFADGVARYHVGGGVVFDSRAGDEYAECLLKARFAGVEPAIVAESS